MLTMLATLGAEVSGGVLRIFFGLSDSVPESAQLLPGLLLFVAAVTGLICLSLTPIVYRFRRVPPPTGVTALAITVSTLPLVIGILQSLR